MDTVTRPPNEFWLVIEHIWKKQLEWADSHCWKCDGELDEDERKAEKCPHCGADLVPF